MTDGEDKHGPGIRFPPPLLAVAIICLAMLFDRALPLPILQSRVLWLTGAAIVILALVLALVALLHFFKARTHVEPWHPTSTIIDGGIFRYTRNPIYLAFCVATAGIGLLLNSWWVLACLPLLVFLLRRLVIEREEAYLEAKFGETYLEFKRRVRRWL